MNNLELLTRLQASPEYDAAILRIAEGDFGCEERETPMLWILFLLQDGSQTSQELPESLMDRLGLTEGSLCRLSDLSAK